MQKLPLLMPSSVNRGGGHGLILLAFVLHKKLVPSHRAALMIKIYFRGAAILGGYAQPSLVSTCTEIISSTGVSTANQIEWQHKFRDAAILGGYTQPS